LIMGSSPSRALAKKKMGPPNSGWSHEVDINPVAIT
jgi:hypothetical protein